MKKLLLFLIVFCSFQMATYADNDTPIRVNQLPGKAQSFIANHFNNNNVSFSKMERDWFEKNYTVFFTNGTSLEFDKNGEWTEIRDKVNGLSADILPVEIKTYLEKNYPGVKVLKIEKERKGIDVELSNKLDIKFNTKYQVVDIDN